MTESNRRHEYDLAAQRPAGVLAEMLGIERVTAAGMLLSLYCRAPEKNPDYNLDKWTPRQFAAAMEWQGHPGELMESLFHSGAIYYDRREIVRLMPWEFFIGQDGHPTFH